ALRAIVFAPRYRLGRGRANTGGRAQRGRRPSAHGREAAARTGLDRAGAGGTRRWDARWLNPARLRTSARPRGGPAPPSCSGPAAGRRAPARALGTALAEAVGEVLADQQCILGPHVERFERAMAEYCGVAHAVGVASGTDALLLALAGLGVGPGSLVVTTPFTF